MDNLHDLQNIWQNHQTDRELSIDADKILESILNKIKNTERKVLRINIFKTLTVSVLIIYFIRLFILTNSGGAFSWIGVGFISISTIVMMILYWKIQFKSSNLNHNLPQSEFVSDAVHQMRSHKKQFIKLFSWFVFFIIIGINLFYIDLLIDLDSGTGLMYHFAITFFLLLTFYMGLKFREKRFKKEFQPLIDELESVNE